MQLLGVADLDLNQPGIALARARGVPVTTRFMELVDAALQMLCLLVTSRPADSDIISSAIASCMISVCVLPVSTILLRSDSRTCREPVTSMMMSTAASTSSMNRVVTGTRTRPSCSCLGWPTWI